MSRPYRERPNKSEQIASFLLPKGRAMTAREIFEAGFRFSDDEITTASKISVLLNKLHVSGRYVVERGYVLKGRCREVEVKVLRIAESLYGKDDPNQAIRQSHLEMWRWLLSRKEIEVCHAI